jgi:hypothetical protein
MDKNHTCSGGGAASGSRDGDAGLERSAVRREQHVVRRAGPGGRGSRAGDATSSDNGRHDTCGGGCHGYKLSRRGSVGSEAGDVGGQSSRMRFKELQRGGDVRALLCNWCPSLFCVAQSLASRCLRVRHSRSPRIGPRGHPRPRASTPFTRTALEYHNSSAASY